MTDTTHRSLKRGDHVESAYVDTMYLHSNACDLRHSASCAPKQAGTCPRLEEKIRDLLHRRGVLEFAARELSADSANLWIVQALEIQRRIYALDFHYESTAAVGGQEEAPLWARLRDASTLVTMQGRGFLQKAVCTLVEYAQDERRLHEGVPFDLPEWRAVLSRKCADVCLARELVYAAMPSGGPSPHVRRFLHLYDQIMELVEDWEDLREDTHDWNLNFWLTPVRQGGCPYDVVVNAQYVLRCVCMEAEAAWAGLSLDERKKHGRFWKRIRVAANLIRLDPLVMVQRLSSLNWIPYSLIEESSSHPALVSAAPTGVKHFVLV